jgi:hypothetical protein
MLPFLPRQTNGTLQALSCDKASAIDNRAPRRPLGVGFPQPPFVFIDILALFPRFSQRRGWRRPRNVGSAMSRRDRWGKRYNLTELRLPRIADVQEQRLRQPSKIHSAELWDDHRQRKDSNRLGTRPAKQRQQAAAFPRWSHGGGMERVRALRHNVAGGLNSRAEIIMLAYYSPFVKRQGVR